MNRTNKPSGAPKPVTIKTLVKTGNSLALVIDKATLELMDVDQETPLEVTCTGEVIIVSKVVEKRRKAKFKTAMEEVHSQHRRLLERLSKA